MGKLRKFSKDQLKELLGTVQADVKEMQKKLKKMKKKCMKKMKKNED